MANHTHNNGKVLGKDSGVWGYWSALTFVSLVGVGSLFSDTVNAGYRDFALLSTGTNLLLFLAVFWAWVLALARESQVKKEQEGRKEIQKILSSPSSKLTADPALYKRAQAELQARKEDALKMQELHALRQQVEDEERKAGIFASTLSPTRSQADPMAAEMARLAQRKVEAERQKHLMKSLRTVEDAEWEADDV